MKVQEVVKILKAYKNQISDTVDLNKVKFVKKAYDNVIHLLKELDFNETLTVKKINQLPITEHMRQKLLPSNLLKLKKLIKNTLLYEQILEVKGIGEDKAKELIKNGLSDVKQLKLRKFFELLPENARAYVVFNPLTHIPHKLIKKLENKLIKDPLRQIIVGSYRRKKDFSRDIDIMIISDNHVHLDNYLDWLILTHKQALVIYAKGKDKVSLILLNVIEKKNIKIDIFRCSEEEAPAMLLYSTGSKEFNIKMRGIAKKQGLILNQKCLFDKSTNIKVPNIKSEKDIFKALKIIYVEPEKRI